MSTQKLTENESIATAELASDAMELGVDAEENTHLFSRIAAEVVIVTPAGTVERRIDLEGRTLSAYLAFIDDRRGWERLNYREAFADVLGEALETH